MSLLFVIIGMGFHVFFHLTICPLFICSLFISVSLYLFLTHTHTHAHSLYSAMFSQLMDTAEPWFSSFEREVRKVSLIRRTASDIAIRIIDCALYHNIVWWRYNDCTEDMILYWYSDERLLTLNPQDFDPVSSCFVRNTSEEPLVFTP